MKVSEITGEYLVDYLKLDDPDDNDMEIVDTCLDAAKNYIASHTGMTGESMEKHEDITIAILVLVEDMYDNRRYYVDNKNVNLVVESIIDQYSENLL